jgi:hypothetical protein
MGAQLLFHQPSVDLPYDLRLLVFDHDLLGGGVGLGDISIAVGGHSPIDPPLFGRPDPAASGALLDEGPLVLGEDALDLEQHLLLGRLAEGVVEEDDLAAGALELLADDDLVGVLPGQAVRRVDQDLVEGTFGGKISQAVQRRAIQSCTAKTLVDEDVFGRDVQAALPGCAA